ncbi:MAG: sugar phosphate isomerase/epimerase [Bifidobacteriaceae bacterium]|jgi:myo-inositol catabolism protein IolH|nr:sugar phosphate isomerase/epimerase [Bifidobacteriaceae bacterium]
MVTICLDPQMYHSQMSVANEVRHAADLGFDSIELSPRADWFYWHRYPTAGSEAIAEAVGAMRETGTRIHTLVPVFNWSSPDESERRGQVRNWRRLLEIADALGCRLVNSELSGDPNRPRESEAAFHRSIEELAPHFERYGLALNLEAHPYDFLERNDEAVDLVRGLDLDWVNYLYCAPHTFHLSNGARDVARMLEYAGSRLAHVHVADVFNHTGVADGNRYIVNPPGVDARVHQHNEIGHGEVPWEEFFASLRRLRFDGVATVCVFGWNERADQIHRAMLGRLRAEFALPPNAPA